MSFRCDECNKVVEGAENKRVSEVRNVNYTRFLAKFNNRDRKTEERFDTVFSGKEIVKENRLCSDCYNMLKDVMPVVNKATKSVSFIGTGKKKVKKEDSDFDCKEEIEKRR